jgi:hypothetical protein
MRSAGAAKRSVFERLWDFSFRPGLWLLSRFSRLDQTQRPILWVVGLFIV